MDNSGSKIVTESNRAGFAGGLKPNKKEKKKGNNTNERKGGSNSNATMSKWSMGSAGIMVRRNKQRKNDFDLLSLGYIWKQTHNGKQSSFVRVREKERKKERRN